MTLLCEVKQKRDFSRPIARRATEVLCPISRHRIAHVLSAICCASRGTCPRLAVGSIRKMCHGFCKLKRFSSTTKAADRVASSNQIVFATTIGVRALRPFFLPLSGGRQVFACVVTFFCMTWLITQTACLSIQHRMLTLGVIDASVYVHNRHRHNRNDPGNLQIRMQGRIRLMTALTPAYGHAVQTVCLGRRAGDMWAHNFRLIAPRNNYRSLPNIRTTTRLVGDKFRSDDETTA